MASATVDQRQRHHHHHHHHHHNQGNLHLESIPLVDLRLLTQSELLSLSICSSSPSTSHTDTDTVSPKIDRSVFNESAGSRKQTFSRLRLAPPRHNSSPSKSNPAPLHPTPEPPDEESARILSLFKSLFNIQSQATDTSSQEDEDLVPVQVEYTEHTSLLSNDGIGAENAFLRHIPVGIVSCSGIKRKRGRPRKDDQLNWVGGSKYMVIEETEINEGWESANDKVNSNENSGDASSCSEIKRKRGRPRRNENDNWMVESKERKNVSGNESKMAITTGNSVDKDMVMVNRNGELVDLVALGNTEDPFGEQLRRMAQGIETKEELLEFLGMLKGEWGATMKKKRIVDASDFGDVLPVGWKLMLCVKKKASHAWLACRRYISPNGRQFVSCKEVSSYLLSLFELRCTSQQNSGNMGDGIQLGINVTSGNLPITSISAEHKKQVPLLKEGYKEEVQKPETIKCHSCSLTFNQADDLISHLLASHESTSSESEQAASIKEVIIKDGKYKCHFCHELFEEKPCYDNHLGIHMKNYVKKVEGSADVITMQKSYQPVTVGVPPQGSNMLESIWIRRDYTAKASNLAAKGERRLDFPSDERNEHAIVESFTYQNRYEGNFLFHHEQVTKVDRNDNKLTEKSCDKKDIVCSITSNKVEKVDMITGIADAEPNVRLETEKVLSNSVNNGISESPYDVDVSLPINPEVENKRELEGTFFYKNIVDRHFTSKMEEKEICDVDKVARDYPKSGYNHIHPGPSDVVIDVKQQSCVEGYSHVPSVNEQTLVINNNLNSVSFSSLEDSEHIAVIKSGNNESSDGVGTHCDLKKTPERRREGALLTLYGSEQNFGSCNSAKKALDGTISGLIHAGSSNDTGLKTDIMSSAEQSCLGVPNSKEHAFTCTMEELRQDGRSEGSVLKPLGNEQRYNGENNVNRISSIDNTHNRVDTCILTGTGQRSCSLVFSGNEHNIANRNAVPSIAKGIVDIPKQSKGSLEELFCLPASEPTHADKNLNMTYRGTVDEEARLENFENLRNNEVMIDFCNDIRPSEDAMTGFIWKSEEENVLLRGLDDTSSRISRSSGCYPSFGAISNKDETQLFNVREKFNHVSGFEELRSSNIDRMGYNFLMAQTSTRSEDSKVSSYDSDMAQRYDSSAWLEKEALPLLPKIASRHQVTMLCSWCGNEFHHEAVDTPKGSLVVLCTICRASFSRNNLQ